MSRSIRTPQEIKEIYKLWDMGVTNKTEISRRVSIHRTSVRRILDNRETESTPEPFLKGSVALALVGTQAEGRVSLISSGKGTGMLFKLFGTQTAPIWKCQWWSIDDPRIGDMVGVKLVLCESQDSPAHLGGEVTKASLTDGGAWVFHFKEDPSLKGYRDHIKREWNSPRWLII